MADADGGKEIVTGAGHDPVGDDADGAASTHAAFCPFPLDEAIRLFTEVELTVGIRRGEQWRRREVASPHSIPAAPGIVKKERVLCTSISLRKRSARAPLVTPGGHVVACTKSCPVCGDLMPQCKISACSGKYRAATRRRDHERRLRGLVKILAKEAGFTPKDFA